MTKDGLHISIESEQSVIGALLIDNGSFDNISELRPEHFYNAENRLIFTEIFKQISSGKACDVISVFDGLNRSVDLGYLNSISQNTPSSANIRRYAEIVREKSIRRQLIGIGQELSEEAFSSVENSTELMEKFTSKIEVIGQTKSSVEPVHVSEILSPMVEQIDALYNGDAPPAISTGYKDVDKLLSGGMRGGELIILAGRPAMGKTALALNISNHVAETKSALFLSMEMPLSQLSHRNTASIGKVPLSHLLEPKLLRDNDWVGITHAVQKMNNLSLYLDDKGGLRLMDVRAKAKYIKRKFGLNLLVIDYLQLMGGEGNNRNEQIGGITRGLKALAKELDITIIVLSQLSRKVEERPNKRPLVSDLRDSGEIEQDADVIIFVYRDEVYNPDSPDKGTAEIVFAKVRQGSLGIARLTYFGDIVRFENCFNWTPSPTQTNQKSAARKGLAANL